MTRPDDAEIRAAAIREYMSAIGKLGRGKAKNLTPAERERRRQHMHSVNKRRDR